MLTLESQHSHTEKMYAQHRRPSAWLLILQAAESSMPIGIACNM